MYLQKQPAGSATDFSAEIKRLKCELDNAAAIVIGAAAGLSAAAGFTYSGDTDCHLFNFTHFYPRLKTHLCP